VLEFLLRRGQGGKGPGEVAEFLVMRNLGCDIYVICGRDITEMARKIGKARDSQPGPVRSVGRHAKPTVSHTSPRAE
jgi:hypothetical protein